ncbi:MAG: Smr/MutS family protein [Bacteroidota bacterium]
MIYTIGSRVRLKLSGDTGSVSDILGEDLVQVKLDGGLGYIPVPTDALTYEHEPPDGKPSQGARYLAGKPPKNDEQEPVQLDLGYTILNPWGVQLAFDPVQRLNADPERYRVYLINDTGHPLIFQVKLLINKQATWNRVGQLDGTAYFELGDLKHNELNDSPSFEVEVRPQLSTGTGPKHHQLLKIKPKQFFSKWLTAPLLNRKVYHYVVFPTIRQSPAPAPTAKKESLAAYTSRQKKRPQQQPSYLSAVPSPQEIAHFPPEIDLHITALLEDPKKVNKQQYLGIQLDHCRAYLRKANTLGVERVYLIHGLGEGKLKQAIHRELRKMTFVKSFRNEFHPKYGHGATEVIF